VLDELRGADLFVNGSSVDDFPVAVGRPKIEALDL
jgi:hypothetical protein